MKESGIFLLKGKSLARLGKNSTLYQRNDITLNYASVRFKG